MPRVHEYNVVPSLPEALTSLRELAYNLRWSWNHDIIDLFRRLERDLWEEAQHNPAAMLGAIRQERLEVVAQDDAFIHSLERIAREHQEYLEAKSWYARTYSQRATTIAYFSAEFGLTECLAIYSGGLGVLSGDHMKSSSELGIPLVGVGLAYQKGYCRQYLNADGWQQERYPRNDFFNLPATLERAGDGQPVLVEVPFPGRVVWAQVWRLQVGRIPLYLLDTNVAANTEEDQAITAQLYGGDRETRIRQEIVLGIGGLRALRLLGIQPTVCHMNEGHSAFQALERIRQTMAETGVGYAEAHELCMAGNVFTTHTPVPAGFDVFPRQLMERHFSEYVTQLGLSMDGLLRLGRNNPHDVEEGFNMALLAVRNSSYINGVSALHGVVSRRLFQAGLPAVPRHEIGATHVTNGAHARSWISLEMTELLTRYLGRRWAEDPADQTVWQRVDHMPDEELWRTHERRRERLVARARRMLRAQLVHRGASPATAAAADEVLDPTALTIGFARRFATYKRASLLLRDMERLRKILLDGKRPVQLIVAGKAHPRDDSGKELIREIIHASRDEELRRRLVFLEDYDLEVARYMVQGVDVWLNTPRRPMEASGTSGMKVVFNGGLNLSILDGWWAEGYRPGVGWAIGAGEEYPDHDYQDRVESEALYDLLEDEVVPTFYERGRDGLPRKWIAMMKCSIRELGPLFNSNRMVHEYTERFYLPADDRYQALRANGGARAAALAKYKSLIQQYWGEIEIRQVTANGGINVRVGDKLPIRGVVKLGSLTPAQVAVQVYDGSVGTLVKVSEGDAVPMTWLREVEKGVHEYQGEIPCRQSGHRGFTLRVIPNHADLRDPLMLGRVVWEGNGA